MKVVNTMEFVRLSEKDTAEYDALVDASTEGTLFHKSWWFDIFRGSRGINADSVEIYGAFNNGEMIAGFPIPYRKKFGRKWIINPILTPYSGTVFKPDGIKKACTEYSFRKDVNSQFIQIIRPFGTCLYYALNLNSMDLQPFLWSDYRATLHYTYLLKLDSLEQVWEQIDRKRRNDIKSAQKKSYRISTGDIDAFVRLNNHSMERQSHGLIPAEAWKSIYAGCKKHDCVEVFTAFEGAEPVASLFMVWDNKRAYYIGGGIAGNSRGGMSLLLWEAIKFTRETLGLSEFDFEGSTVPGIEVFFRSFGGELRPFFGIKDWRFDLAMSVLGMVKK